MHALSRWFDEQVLTPLDERSLMSTPAGQNSIMCYQLPGSITRDGKPIVGELDIDPTDYAFAGKIYPKPGHAAVGAPNTVLFPARSPQMAKEISADAARGRQFDPPLTEDELAFYDAVAQNESAVTEMGTSVLAGIARDLVKALRRDLTIRLGVSG